MKTLKKSLAMLLALVMSLGCMSVGVWADVEPTSEPTQEPEQGSYSVTDATSNETYSGLYKVFEGFYQDGAKYDSTSNFYITNKDGLKYFRDWVNGTSDAWNAYEGFLNLSLASFASNNGMAGMNVHLLADIDLTGEVWQPIGPNSGAVEDKFASNWKAHFYGSFYGHNHVVSNMDTSESDQGDKYSRWPQGFFGSIASCGVIDGLTMENVTVKSNFWSGYAGAIVGDLGSAKATISNCTVRGSITITGGYSGAIYGIGNADVINCTVEGEEGSAITGNSFAGGLVGAQRNNNIDQSITGNKVSGVKISSSSQYAGGLVGAMASGAAGTLTIGGNDVADDVEYTGVYSDKLIVEFDDADKATLTEGWYSTVIKYPVAQIGNEYYTTLAEAIDAVPTDGTETTITMVADETIIGNAGVTIPTTKNVVLDLNGHTVKNAVNENKGSQVITNKGTLTIKDSVEGGLITNAVQEGTQPGEWWSTPQYNYATNVITNSGTLNMESGTIRQTAAGSICYAVDNNSTSFDTTFNMKGGLVADDYGTVVRMFCNSTTKENIINVTGGEISTPGYTAIWTQLPGSSGQAKKAMLNISGGTLKAGTYAWYDYTYGDVFDNVSYNFSGGVFDAQYSMYSYGVDEFVTGGLYKGYPYYIAPGYAAVQVTEGDYEGWYLVGPIQYASREIITVDEDTYLVKSYVEDDAKNELEVASTSVAVASITEEAITADEALNTKTTDTVSLANIDTKKVAETAAAQVAADNVEGANTIEVTVSLSKTADDTTNLITTGVTGEVFEVHPVATYVVKDENGAKIENAGGTIDVAKTTVGSFTFKLYLGSGFTSGQLVTVEHYGDGDDQAPTETWNKKVQSDNNGLYVELTLDSFSHVAVKANSDPTATVDYTVKIADATSGTAVIYPGDSVTMNVTVSGDDFYGGDFTIEYDNTAFEKVEESFAAGINPQDSRPGYTEASNRLNYNLVKAGDRLTDGSTIFSVIFKAKDTLNATATYDFKVIDARVNYDNTKNADIVESQYRLGDKVTVNATKYTVKFDGESNEWEYSVYQGKGVDTIPTDVKTGYTFKGWALTDTATTALTADAIRNAAVTANVTYYPVFEAEQYNVTLSGTTTDNEPAKATFGQNYTATISDYDAANYDYTVTYKSGTDASKTLDLSEESNFNAETGAFTIPAADITGELKVTVEKTLKGFEVELHADYVTGYTLVLVRAAEGNNSNPIYTYGNGPMFFVNELTKTDESKVYGAYAILVEGAITESAARAKVGITTTEATELTIQTDVNATNLVDSSDLQAAFSGYKVQLTLPEQMAIYLRADVNGDYKLDTADVGLINSARTK